MEQTEIPDIQALEDFARSLVEKLGEMKKAQATVVALYGDLGVGKTAFIKAVAKTLGVKEDVTSPTFVIEKIYKLVPDKIFAHLVHVDAYRLESERELSMLGWDDIVKNPKNLICVEWADKVESLIPQNATRLRLEILQGEKREATFL